VLFRSAVVARLVAVAHAAHTVGHEDHAVFRIHGEGVLVHRAVVGNQVSEVVPHLLDDALVGKSRRLSDAGEHHLDLVPPGRARHVVADSQEDALLNGPGLTQRRNAAGRRDVVHIKVLDRENGVVLHADGDGPFLGDFENKGLISHPAAGRIDSGEGDGGRALGILNLGRGNDLGDLSVNEAGQHRLGVGPFLHKIFIAVGRGENASLQGPQRARTSLLHRRWRGSHAGKGLASRGGFIIKNRKVGVLLDFHGPCLLRVQADHMLRKPGFVELLQLEGDLQVTIRMQFKFGAHDLTVKVSGVAGGGERRTARGIHSSHHFFAQLNFRPFHRGQRRNRARGGAGRRRRGDGGGRRGGGGGGGAATVAGAGGGRGGAASTFRCPLALGAKGANSAVGTKTFKSSPAALTPSKRRIETIDRPAWLGWFSTLSTFAFMDWPISIWLCGVNFTALLFSVRKTPSGRPEGGRAGGGVITVWAKGAPAPKAANLGMLNFSAIFPSKAGLSRCLI